ncbi:MAG TPA: hypothetical protein DCX95_01260 [Elusimicrobia bacterium]|nr:hypothetical protein [Elusimicrobiota bacterium]
MEHIKCNLCGSDNTFVKIRIKEYFHGNEMFDVVQCKNCGLIYTNPRPSSEELNNYYPQNYSPFQFSYPAPFFADSKTGSAKLKNIIKKKFLRIHYNYFSDNKSMPLLIKSFLKILTAPIKHKTGWIFPPYKKNGKILDLGCSTGFYLTRLKELGWETFGVEINPDAAQWGKEKLKLNIFNGTLESAKFPSDYFDAITLWHTLEHVPYPMNTLKEIYRILKKDGIIIVGVPNVDTIERKIFGKWWWAWEVPRHFYHYSPETLSNFLKKNNFNVMKIEFPANVYNIILSLQILFLNCFPKKEKQIKKFLEPDKHPLLCDILSPLGYLLSFFKQTGRMIIYAKK